MSQYNTKNPKRAPKAFIQGDVSGEYVDTLPATAKPINDNIVAHGEVTGHHHIVEGATMYKDDFGNLFAKVEAKTGMLLHQEHAAWILAPGIIKFGENGVTQVEYDGEEERRALD